VSPFSRISKKVSLGIVLSLAVLASPAVAQEPPAAPDQPLASPAQEARARALFADVRCVVCQHESIADSPAGIAADMRRLVREEIAAGADDATVRADLVDRYGDYILFRPPVRLATGLLWFGPFALVLAVGAVLAVLARRRRPVTPPLSPDEERRLAELLDAEAIRPDADASSPHDGR
jgi:cytochrome c-type biogenesis protein CcmH